MSSCFCHLVGSRAVSRRAAVLAVAGALAGILVLGSAVISARDNTVTVHPGDNLQNLVDSHPAGTEFHLESGIYRLQSVKPKDGDVFSGESGAILNGSTLLTSFNHQGQYWTADVKTEQQGSYRGECDSNRPACMYPEDVFIDNSPLQRVASLSDVSQGKWYLDYDSGKAYLGDNPQGRTVEIGTLAHAFYGPAKDVKIEGLRIEKYAETAGSGAVGGGGGTPATGSGWLVQNNDIELNHGMGIATSNGMRVLNNKLEHNGQLGIGGSGKDVTVDGNEIAYNNYAGYKYGWEAGGAKFTFTNILTVRNNYAHDNNGPGLWTDLNNRNTLYDHNRTRSNQEAGILEEISSDAVIRDNQIDDDGFSSSGQTAPWYGGGIVITASQNVEVYGNTVTDCMNGIVGLQSERPGHFLRNLYVHDNTVTQKNGIAAGISKSGHISDDVYTGWHNRFVNNTFHLASEHGKYFEWMNRSEDHSAWKARGQGQ